jgi:AhpC/TSA family
LVDFYELHKDARDKFEIVAFHVGTEKTFEEIDKNLASYRQLYWFGRQLPFPSLADSTGKTAKLYGIASFPTTLLIDPEGKLVGNATEEHLEAKLPPVAMPTKIAQALDKMVQYTLDDPTLSGAIQTLSKESRIPIRLDLEALKTVAIAPDAKIPYKMAGLVTLRSGLNLVLAGLDLGFERDERGLVITRKQKASRSEELSQPQQFCVKRIEEVLARKTTYDFQMQTLDEVAKHFEGQTRENFVLDPAARRVGALEPKAIVTGSGKDIPLQEGLKKLLDPLGLKAVIRDEVVVITSKSLAG